MRSSAKGRAAAAFVLGVAAALLIGCEQPTQRTDVRVMAFTASWCGPCQVDKPRLEQIERYVVVVRVDTDNDWSGATQQFKVDGLPTYIVYTAQGEQFRTGDIEEVARALNVP